MLGRLALSKRGTRILACLILLGVLGVLATTGHRQIALSGAILPWSDLTTPKPNYGQCLATSGLTTKLLGGVPGYWFLENVWFKDGTFYMYNQHLDELPSESEMLSGHTKLVVEPSLSDERIPNICFAGTSLFLNEGAADGWNGLWHYYHFAAENILGGFATVATAPAETEASIMPDQLLIPWVEGWRDKWGMNEMVIEGIFQGAVIERAQWLELEKDGDNWIFFEKVAIVDRWASHRHTPAANQWNKMAIAIFQEKLQPHFFSQARETLLDYYEFKKPSHSGPRIVYIDRQNTSRRLSDEVHGELLSALNELSNNLDVEVAHLVLEDMSRTEQIEAIAHATIMIGIHGNGLTHELWMPERSTLIELFPPETFLRDYETVASALGHSYIAVRNDTVYTQAEWEASPGEQHPGRTHDGTPVLLSVPLIVQVLQEILER